jgi:hypothetical protein
MDKTTELLSMHEVEGKVYVKMRTEHAVYTYCFTLENERISSIQLLGNFIPAAISD